MFRRPWFWIGAGLWIVVIGMSFQMSGNKKPAPTTDNQANKSSNGAVLVPAGDESPWSKEGLSDFSFTAHTGETITKADLLGQPWIIDFIFTYCQGTCPKMTAQMANLQEELRDTNIKLVTLTVDPESDTVEQLAQYAKAYGNDPERWLMLTGEKEEIYSLIETDFLMPVQEQPGADIGMKIAHSNFMMLVDEKGVVQEKVSALNDSEVAAFRRRLVKKYGTKSKDTSEATPPVTEPTKAEKPKTEEANAEETKPAK